MLQTLLQKMKTMTECSRFLALFFFFLQNNAWDTVVKLGIVGCYRSFNLIHNDVDVAATGCRTHGQLYRTTSSDVAQLLVGLWAVLHERQSAYTGSRSA
jgi:hypothetical protein